MTTKAVFKSQEQSAYRPSWVSRNALFTDDAGRTRAEGIRVRCAVQAIINEYDAACRKHPTKHHSAHESYAVLLEEVDELKEHVWKKQSKRDLKAMRKEAVQVAAMALRFITDIVPEG